VIESQALRAEYFNFQLPKVVRVSCDCSWSDASRLGCSCSRTVRMSSTSACSTT
jgi:hypothetical protein